MTIGNAIRAARKAKGKTQAEVAENLNVSVQAVSQWETNKTMPSLVKFVELKEYLEWSAGFPVEIESIKYDPTLNLLRYDDIGNVLTSKEAPLVNWKDILKLTGGRGQKELLEFLHHKLIYFAFHWVPVGAAFALKIVDDIFMEPIFMTGDVIILDTGRAPEMNDFVVAEVGRRAILARFRPKGVDIHRAPVFDLVFEHHPTLAISADVPGRVIGTVREHRRFYRTE